MVSTAAIMYAHKPVLRALCTLRDRVVVTERISVCPCEAPSPSSAFLCAVVLPLTAHTFGPWPPSAPLL